MYSSFTVQSYIRNRIATLYSNVGVSLLYFEDEMLRFIYILSQQITIPKQVEQWNIAEEVSCNRRCQILKTS
jgi:hypothetical protein